MLALGLPWISHNFFRLPDWGCLGLPGVVAVPAGLAACALWAGWVGAGLIFAQICGHFRSDLGPDDIHYWGLLHKSLGLGCCQQVLHLLAVLLLRRGTQRFRRQEGTQQLLAPRASRRAAVWRP